MPVIYWFTDDDQFSGTGTDLASAEALVVSWRMAAGKPTSGQCVCFADFYFWGPNVPPEIDGVLQTVEVVTVLDWSIGEWRTNLISAIQVRAAELGLVMGVGNVRLPTYEAPT